MDCLCRRKKLKKNQTKTLKKIYIYLKRNDKTTMESYLDYVLSETSTFSFWFHGGKAMSIYILSVSLIKFAFNVLTSKSTSNSPASFLKAFLLNVDGFSEVMIHARVVFLDSCGFCGIAV